MNTEKKNKSKEGRAMGKKNIDSKKGQNPCRLLALKRGISLVEMLIVVGIIGIMAAILYPSIMNSMETREFENSARDIQSTLQRAKFQAVKTKLNHRVRFVKGTSGWEFFIESEVTQNNWNLITGFIKKVVSPKFMVTVNFPGQAVVFSPLGLVLNFDPQQNSLIIKSPRLEDYNQPDQRIICVYAGGSVHFIKAESE